MQLTRTRRASKNSHKSLRDSSKFSHINNTDRIPVIASIVEAAIQSKKETAKHMVTGVGSVTNFIILKKYATPLSQLYTKSKRVHNEGYA